MSDRGSCKIFSPNIFNPTKCQNCYKPKEGHPTGPSPSQTAKIQRGLSLSISRDRNAAIKTVLKEGFLWIGLMDSETGSVVQDWEKRWYILYSSGELESFPIENGEVMRSQSKGVTVLQDFIRMLDGCTEINIENSLGLKSLKDSLYLKTANKVDFENWWKELSNFVPSPMKRAFSASAAVRPSIGNSKMWLNKTNSNPHQLISSKSSSPQMTSSPQSDTENAQMVGLNSKITKLQQETKRIPKLEEEKRKLELEVNYWKEYVTNASSSKKSGSKADSEKELNQTRSKMIDLQDQFNEVEKKLKVSSAKALVQSKEIDELKGKINESNNQINMHKATINELNSEISSLKGKGKDSQDTVDAPHYFQESKPLAVVTEERILSPLSDASSERGETGDIESKFLTLREKMKRIEKELFLKSKELEKANESRSKVAKYTRTLLQELEAKLNETQRRYHESNEKLSNANMELEIERERRKRLESERDHNSVSRSSSVSSTISSISNQEQQTLNDLVINESSPINDRSENEVSNRYVDYYRSRFREAEAALLQKDKKLNSCESKIKELESRYKTVVKQCRSLDDIQIKLSDATHKLSDRQLKIHELTREVEKLRGYERSYERKSKELDTFKENLRNTDQQLSELKRKVSQQEKDLEMFKIREVVMKERISAFEEESSDESDSEDDDTRLERSIEAQKRVETSIDLEGKLRLISAENEELKKKQIELEGISSQNHVKVKESNNEDIKNQNKEDSMADFASEKEELKKRITELEDQLIVEEDKLCRSLSELKEKHKEEIAMLKSSNRRDISEFVKLKEDFAKMKEKCEKLENQSSNKEQDTQLVNKISELEKEIVGFKERIDEKDKMISDNERKMEDLKIYVKEITDDLNEKSQDLLNLNDNLEEKDTKLKLQIDKIEYLDKLFNETSGSLKNYEAENRILREQLKVFENKLHDEKETQENLRPMNEMADDDDGDTGKKNKALWEDFKKMRDLLQNSQETSEQMRNEMRDVGKKYLESEQKVTELAKELDTRLAMENDMNEWVTSVETKMETIQTQLVESRDSMQTKIDYLEKERNNVIHLVNVTSAYINELENSLAESRNKIDELQSIIEDTRATHGKRIPPEGSSGKDKDDSSSDHSDDVEEHFDDQIHRMNLANQELTSKIVKLESDMAELKSTHDNEKNLLLEGHRIELQALEEKLKSNEVNGVIDVGSGMNDGEETDYPSEKDEKDSKTSNEQFVSKNENLGFLNRIQELEVELEETRQRCNSELKLKSEQHKKEIDDLKDDMAKVLQASIATNYQQADSKNDENVLKLEEKIKLMEKEMEELEEKYEEEIEMEREAHQYEMEETIRDMLTVKDVLVSGKYNEKNDTEENEEVGSQKSSRRSSLVSSEGLEEIRREFDKKLAQKEQEYQMELESMKKDMSTVIDAVQLGGASTAILELTNKNQGLRKEFDELIASYEIEREDYKVKIEKLESGNFFGLRRNEEMGTKIYQMQIEMEELERKQKLELEAYKNVEDATAINELVKINENFEKKIRKLEDELITSKENSIREMEMMTMKVHEEKRKAVSEMTDTVLSLEAIIDEMKDKHEIDIKEFEERSQEEKHEAVNQWKQKVDKLEMLLAECSKDCEERLLCQEDEHHKEIKRLEETYESKVEYYKTLNEENKTHSPLGSDVTNLQQINKELTKKIKEEKSLLQSTIEEMQKEFNQQTEEKQKDFDNQIMEIRNEYEEKLKSCIKESARRQSVSSRKTESQKIKELTSKVEELENAIVDQKDSFELEIDSYRNMVTNLQSLIEELRDDKPCGEAAGESPTECMAESSTGSLPGTKLRSEAVSQGSAPKTRVQELEDQISRYEKRIDYYRQKEEKNESDENIRIAELQEEVEGLKKEMNQLTESHEKGLEDTDYSVPDVNPVIRRRRSDESSDTNTNGRQKYKRWSDLHLMDVVFTNDGVEHKRGPRDRDARKRWSDLQLKQDNIINKIGELEDKKNPRLITQLKRDEIKSGSIARRKKLWENFASDEPKQRPLSSIRP